MKKTSKAVVLTGKEKLEMKEVPILDMDRKSVLLKVEMVGICGSDRGIYLEHNDKSHLYPLLLGHEVVGRIEKMGEEAEKIYDVQVGDRVTVLPSIYCNDCDYCKQGNRRRCQSRNGYGLTRSVNEYPYLNGAYSEYMYIVPYSTLFKVNEDVPPQAACMSSVIGNGVRWIKTKGKVKQGDTVVIIGPGAQGLASTIVAKESGAQKIIVIGLESDSQKLETARELGATHTFVVDQDDILSAVEQITKKDMADVVVTCTGADSALHLGIDLVKPMGKIVLVGLNDGKLNSFNLNKVIRNEIKLIGGYGQSGDMGYAVEIINSQKYEVEKIVSHTFPLHEANEAMNLFVEKPEQCIRVALNPKDTFLEYNQF